MAWISLILAGLFEMFGVAMINKLHKDRNWQSLVLLILEFGLSFIFLSYAMEILPMGTAYAIWTGIGAFGGAIIGMVLYDESKDWRRLVFIGIVLSAAIGLKLVSEIIFRINLLGRQSVFIKRIIFLIFLFLLNKMAQLLNKMTRIF
ncbi:QacE family quaternary ammonium compound efflux SMR transporter [Bacillus toyonensis]|nr:QacE family quaternary ammonium compound efflux SMR transporter [Bacillus toyonensis]